MLLRNPSFTVAAKGRFIVDDPMHWRWVVKAAVVNIHTGFKTDFATIPRPMRALISVNGRHRLAAVLHDYLYANGGAFRDGENIIRYTRKDADQEFLNAMRQLGVGWAKRTSMYSAVRVFGRFFYKDINGVRTWGKG